MTFVLAPASRRLPNGGQRGRCQPPYARPTPSPSQGRVWGPTGQAAHVPPRRDARSAGNSPEPSGPPSARGRTERKPRGTVNSTAPPTAAPPRSPAPHPRLPRGTYGLHLRPARSFAPCCLQAQALHRDVCIRYGANGNPSLPPRVSPPAWRQPAPTATARNSCPHRICSSAKSTLQSVCWQGTRHRRSHPGLLARPLPGTHQMVH